MATESTTTTIDDNTSGNDLLRKIVAAIVGIIVIILIVLLAKWVGDQIKTRFIDKKTTVTTTTTTTDNTTSDTTTTNGTPVYDPKTGTYKIATISAIPSTGPNDGVYLMLGFIALSGIASLTLARRFATSTHSN